MLYDIIPILYQMRNMTEELLWVHHQQKVQLCWGKSTKSIWIVYGHLNTLSADLIKPIQWKAQWQGVSKKFVDMQEKYLNVFHISAVYKTNQVPTESLWSSEGSPSCCSPVEQQVQHCHCQWEALYEIWKGSEQGLVRLVTSLKLLWEHVLP